MHRVHLVIQGRVQGVGFRYFVMKRAQALELTGWVQNLPNGDVELEAEGPRASLDRLVAQVREGPASARVTTVRETWQESAAGYDRFLVR